MQPAGTTISICTLQVYVNHGCYRYCDTVGCFVSFRMVRSLVVASTPISQSLSQNEALIFKIRTRKVYPPTKNGVTCSVISGLKRNSPSRRQVHMAVLLFTMLYGVRCGFCLSLGPFLALPPPRLPLPLHPFQALCASPPVLPIPWPLSCSSSSSSSSTPPPLSASLCALVCFPTPHIQSILW